MVALGEPVEHRPTARRDINLLGDSGAPLTYTVLDGRSDEQALIDAGAFASRMGHARPRLAWIGAPGNDSDTPENSDDFQDRGDAARQAQGIDGTAGDAQDTRHQYVPDKPHPWCLLCGLNENWPKHIDRFLDCGLCYEENGEEVRTHPECTIHWETP